MRTISVNRYRMGGCSKFGKVFIPLLVFTMVFLCCPVQATIILSTSVDATLGGLSFGEEDLVEYDIVTGLATLFFDGSELFSGAEDIDAVHILPNGNIVLSTETGATLGGLTFEDGDMIEYNPLTDIATLYFDEDLFSGNEDIDAKSLMPNGDIVLSTALGATLGGVTFQSGDLVSYNVATDTATLIFDGSELFLHGEDIDAVHILANGHITIVLSTENNATLGGLTFTDGDLIEYDPVTDTAVLIFDGEELFGELRDIDAVYITPEPATICLLGLGLFGLRARRKR